MKMKKKMLTDDMGHNNNDIFLRLKAHKNTYSANPTVKKYFIVKTKTTKRRRSSQEERLIRVREEMRQDPEFVDVIEQYDKI
jgi:hypothetical protein